MREIAAADLSAGRTQIPCKKGEIGASVRLDGMQEVAGSSPCLRQVRSVCRCSGWTKRSSSMTPRCSMCLIPSLVTRHR